MIAGVVRKRVEGYSGKGQEIFLIIGREVLSRNEEKRGDFFDNTTKLLYTK